MSECLVSKKSTTNDLLNKSLPSQTSLQGYLLGTCPLNALTNCICLISIRTHLLYHTILIQHTSPSSVMSSIICRYPAQTDHFHNQPVFFLFHRVLGIARIMAVIRPYNIPEHLIRSDCLETSLGLTIYP